MANAADSLAACAATRHRVIRRVAPKCEYSQRNAACFRDAGTNITRTHFCRDARSTADCKAFACCEYSREQKH